MRGSIRMRWRPWLIGIVLLTLGPASTAGAVETGIHLGGVSTAPQVLAAIGQAHPRWVNIFMGWNGIETAKGQYNEALLQVYEQEFAALPPGTKINVNVAGTPAWATAGGSSDTRQPPANTQDYADFMRYVATRFAGKVTSWEVWNEEDTTAWWLGDVPTYVQMLKQAYPAVKAGDPNAAVVFGGVVGNDYGFLEQAYAAGAAGAFDAFGVHTDTGCGTTSPYVYARDPSMRINRFSFLGYREVHATMVAHGEGGKPIFMTELGWSTSGAQCPTAAKVGGVSQDTQASYLAQAYHCLSADPYVAVGIWFELVDNGVTDTPLNRFGLLSASFAPKPAFAAFAAESQNGDRLTGDCGNFNAPQITISSPTDSQSAPGVLHIAVSASSPAGVPRISLYYDGTHLIRNFTDRTAPKTLTGALDWQGAKHLSPGAHTLTVKAIDPQGNASTQTVTFRHGTGGPPSTAAVLGKSVAAAVVSGQVFVLLPGTGHVAQAGGRGVGFVALTQPRTLPVGTTFDTSAGVVRLTSALNARGAVQSGDFGAGVFKVRQNRRELGLTELRLVVGRRAISSCSLRAGAGPARTAAARRLSSRVLNLLKSTVKGRFRTRGRFSSATVRGTVWQTSDRCDGTLTHVTRGIVVVRDQRRHRQIVLRAGQSYLARA